MIEIPGLKISGPLGQGGTALVAKAYSKELNREVAVKYPLSQNSDVIDKFNLLAARENDLIGRLHSPALVQIFKYSPEPAYLLLEFCPGRTLDQFGKIENVPALLNIICAVAAGLEFLRVNDIIHGDFKPQNIFLPSDFSVTEQDKLFFAKISDFSLGRTIDEPESARAGHGTIGYAAPETMSKKIASHRADLFALGVIAYRLASGIHPFMDGESDPVKIESRIQEDAPAPLGKFRNDLPEHFVELVESLLSKQPENRLETAWAVCTHLRECGANYPFEKVLAPHYLFNSQAEPLNFVDKFLELTPPQRQYLAAMTDWRYDYLRLILTANFRKGNLVYDGGQFSFISNIYLPALLRRKSLSVYKGAPIRLKKQLIRKAVIGSKAKAAKLGAEYRSVVSELPPGFLELLRQLLTSHTIKRHSKLIAPMFEAVGELRSSAEFYLNAGLLSDAVRCAEQFAKNAGDAVERNQAIGLINSIADFAGMQGKEFDIRQLLMLKGDIERNSGDTDGASGTYNQIINLYDNKRPDKLLAETYRDFGDLFKTKQRFEEGIRVLAIAVEIYKSIEDDLEMSRALNNIGELYRIASDLPNALKNLRRALAIQKRLKSVADAANTLNNIAIVYGTKGQLRRTIKLLELSLKMKRTVGDKGEIARALNNLGLAHQLCGEFEKSQSFLKESLALNRQIGSQREIYSNLLNLSETMLKCGNLREAVAHVKEGLVIAVALNLKPHQGDILKTMGNIYLRMNRFSESENCFKRSMSLVEEIDHKILKIGLHISQSDLRFALGDSPQAISLAEQALQEAVALAAELEQLQALTILVRVLGKSEHLNQARAIAENLKLHREKVLLEFAHLQFLLDNNMKENLKTLFAPFEKLLDEMRDDVEYAKLLNTAGEIHIVFGDREKAVTLLSRARQMAQTKSLAAEEITAHILEGGIYFDSGNYEKAFANYKTALQLCKDSAMTIASDEDKQTFMKRPKMLFLANQIRQLNEKMGTKKKAGV